MQPRPPPTTAQLALQPHFPSLHGNQSLHALAQAMQNHPEDAEKQLFGVISFAAVCSGADLECKGRAMDAGAFEALLHALRYHSHVPSMQEWVARCFESLPVALWSFIQTLKRDPQDVELQILGGMCLARLHKPECHEAAADAGVCEAFVQAMRLHADDNEVQNAAAIGLRANCRGPTSKPLPPKVANKTTKLALGHGAVDALVEAEDFDVLYNCTLALGSIVRFRAQECRKHAGEIVQVMLRALKSPRQDFRVTFVAKMCLKDVPGALCSLVETMNSAPADVDVQHWSSWWLAEVFSADITGPLIVDYPTTCVLHALVCAMQKHPTRTHVQTHAAVALGAICAGWDSDALERQRNAVDAGALQVVVQALV